MTQEWQTTESSPPVKEKQSSPVRRNTYRLLAAHDHFTLVSSDGTEIQTVKRYANEKEKFEKDLNSLQEIFEILMGSRSPVSVEDLTVLR